MLEILSKEGFIINPGTSTKMIYNYDKDLIDASESRIKEWDFYQFNNDEYCIQLTIGHASLFDSCGFTIFSLNGKERYNVTNIGLHSKNSIIFENNPVINHSITVNKKNFYIRFSLNDDNRHLVCRGIDKKLGKYELIVDIPNDKLNDKMVILTPFTTSKKMFYLNYKENYYNAKISFKSDIFKINIKNINGLIDFGRGYWPYIHEWYWGSHSTIIQNHKIGWNIGFGFGINKFGNENYFFFDSKAYKIEIDFNVLNHPKGKIILDSKDGLFHLELIPYFNNHTETKVLWICNSCDQVFYKTLGYVIVNNQKYGFKDEISFLEHAKNRW